MRRLSRLGLLWPALAVAVAAIAAVAVSSGNTSAATRWTANAGGGRAGISVDMFMPSVININEGDSIQWNNPYEEIHTVTFLGRDKLPDLLEVVPSGTILKPPTVKFAAKAFNAAPARGTPSYDGTSFINSGILAKGSPATSWTVTFPKAGSYPFVCIVHPFMTGVVNVLGAGVYVAPQAQRDAEAAQQLEATLRQGEAIAAAVRTGSTRLANGTTSWEVVTPGAPPGIAINRFAPARIQIGVGDTVVWNNPNPGPPHTVTFGEPPAAAVANVPDDEIPAVVAFPVKPSQTYDGRSFYNSGIISTGPEATGGSSFSLTFPAAGTFPYICVLHIDQGMAGVVVVGGGGAGGGITAPSTGDAGLASRSGGGLLFYAAGLALLMLAGGGAWRLRRR